MRTLRNLAALGALLLVASGANATITFTVSTGADIGPGQEIDVAITLAGSAVDNVTAYSFDWLLNGAAIPLSAVQGPVTAPPGGVPGQTQCTTGTAFQYMCNFAGTVSVGTSGNNIVGDGWLWSVTGAQVDGTQTLIGRFTFTDTAAGLVSTGNCENPQADTFENIDCTGNNSVALNPIPEPTTAALLGLGLAGLVVGGRSGRRR
jgi:hypothetical protein